MNLGLRIYGADTTFKSEKWAFQGLIYRRWHDADGIDPITLN